jgi:hypothetical protein
MRNVVRFLGVLGALAMLAARGFADTAWTSGSDGFWSNPQNWSAGLPNQMQSVTAINNSNTKMVRLDSSADATNRVIQRLNLSNGSGGSTNTLLIDGTELTMRNTVTIDTGGTMIVTNGGAATIAGSGSTSFNILAGQVHLLSGSISSLTSTTRVGRVKSGALTISGGAAHLSDILVGDFSGSSGTLVVDGGVLNVSSNLVIADDVGSTGAVVIVSGELNMSNSNAVLRVGDDNIGQMRVYGGMVRLDIDDLTVGRRTNSIGFLLVAGGRVITTDISAGRFMGATGIVMVTGGELLLTNDSLRIGREGVGQFYMTNGLVRANDATVGQGGAALGLFRLHGGEVDLRSNMVCNGICEVNGGTLDVQHLSFTNNLSQMIFSSGTVRSRGAFIANQQPFIVGDGVNPATYYMNGGVHEFANGLVISPNATLSGCGTIIGTVINNGTISTNCTVARPMIVNVQRVGSTLSLSFATQAGPTYFVEYEDRLSDASWLVLETRVGDGSVMTVVDPAATAMSRFYRIRVP